MKKKLTWSKPKLLVIVKRKPDETVLQSCKIPTLAYLGANTNAYGCAVGSPCGMCSAAGS